MDRSKRGFTLIELLAVIAIIGILAGVVTISYASSRIKSRDAKRKSDVIAINDAIKLYAINNNGIVPEEKSNEEIGTGLHLCNPESSDTFYEDRWNYIETKLTLYLENGKLPLDPVGKCEGDEPWDGSLTNGKKFGYVYFQNNSVSNTKYAIWVALENTKDPDTNSQGNPNSFDPLTGKYNRVFGYNGWILGTSYDNQRSNIANIYGKGSPYDLIDGTYY